MTTFENPVALLLSFSAKPRFLRLAPLDPPSLPMNFIDVNHWQARALAERLRQRTFARSGLADDHDPLHGVRLYTA